MRRARTVLISAAATTAAIAVTQICLGQVSGTWIGSSTGTWSASQNRTSHPQSPGGGGSATFARRGPVQVALDAPVLLGGLRFDSLAQVDVVPSSSSHTISFGGPRVIEVAAYKQNKPGVAPYYFGHRIGGPVGTAFGSAGGPINVTGPGALAFGGLNFSSTSVAITGSTVSIENYYGLGVGTLASTLDAGTLRFAPATPGVPHGLQRPLTLGAGGGTFDVLAPGTVSAGSISGTGGLTLTGTNTGSFIFYSDLAHAGATRVIGGGSVALNLYSNARLANTSALSVSGDVNLFSYDVASGSPDKLTDGELALRGARLNIGHNRNVAYHEHTGTLSLRGGLNTVAFYPESTGAFTTQPLSLTAAALDRQDRALLRASTSGGQFGGGVSNAVVRLQFDGASPSVPLAGGGGAAGSTNVSIVPFAFIDTNTTGAPPGFMTYDAGGLRPLTFGEYATALPAASVSDVNLRAGNVTMSEPKTINSLIATSVQGTATLTVTSGAVYGVQAMAPINFGPAEGVFINGGVSAPMSGTNGVTFAHTGVGSLALHPGASSTYTGQTTIASGTVAISTNVTAGQPGPFGADSSAVVLMGRTVGATLSNHTSSTITFGRDLLVRADADLYNDNAPALRGFMNVTGNVTLEGPLQVQPSVLIAGDISGPGRLVAIGPFTSSGPGSALVLSGNNTFSGGVDVGTGTVAVGSDTALGAGPVYVGDGPAAGSGTVGTIYQPQGPARAIANNFLLFDDLHLRVTDQPITLTGTIDLNGESRTLRSSAQFAINPNHVNLNGRISGGDLHLAGRFNLAGENDQWTTTVDLGVSSVRSDHALGAAPVLTQIGSGVFPGFTSVLELSGGVTIPAHRLRINGHLPVAMTFASVAGENTWEGDVEVIGRGAISVTGLGAPQPTLGLLTIRGGIVGVDAGAGTPAPSIEVRGPGTLATAFVRTPGELRLVGNVRMLDDGTDAATSRVGTLTLSPSSKLDLADNALVIDYTGASPLATVRGQLATGFAGGSWTGNGINSSAAADTPGTALGFAEAADLFTSFPATFRGIAVDDTAVLIAHARAGDADLSGNVNLQDFNRLAAHFGGTDKVWSQGDFNYDGNVNLQDFNLLAANFGLSAAGSGVTPADWAGLAAAIPEPTGAGAFALACAAPLLHGRRRRR